MRPTQTSDHMTIKYSQPSHGPHRHADLEESFASPRPLETQQLDHQALLFGLALLHWRNDAPMSPHNFHRDFPCLEANLESH